MEASATGKSKEVKSEAADVVVPEQRQGESGDRGMLIVLAR